jgi:hypothetical protein
VTGTAVKVAAGGTAFPPIWRVRPVAEALDVPELVKVTTHTSVVAVHDVTWALI